MDPLLLEPDGYLGPFLSAVTVYGAAAILPGLLGIACLVRLIRYRRLARAADQVQNEGHELTEGETVIYGAVETLDAASSKKPAVHSEILQTGSESEGSGTWSFEWVDGSATTVVEPFVLTLRGGVRVRVEPTPEVVLGFPYKVTRYENERSRVCAVELRSGRLFARGELVRTPGGVDPETGAGTRRKSVTKAPWTLRTPEDHHMVLSPEPLSRPMRGLADDLSWYLVASVMLMGCSSTLNLGYYSDRDGTVVTGEVTAKTTEEKLSWDGETKTHYRLTVRLPPDSAHTLDTTRADYRRAEIGARVVALVSNPEAPISPILGTEPRVGNFSAMVQWFLLFGLFGLFAKTKRNTRTFYGPRTPAGVWSGRLPTGTPDMLLRNHKKYGS